LAARIARRGPEAAGALAALANLGLTGARLQGPADRALALLSGPDPALRLLAARALGRVGFAPAGTALLRRGQALVQRIAEARRKWLPGPLGDAPAFPPGTAPDAAAVAARPPPSARAGAGAARPPPEWIDDVDPSEAAELAAVAVALARLRAEGAGPFIVPLAADPDAAVRAGAVEALALLGGDAARVRAAEALSDPSPAVRAAAAAVLPRFGRAAVPALAEALRRSTPGDREERGALIRALGDTGSPEAVPAIAGLLDAAEAPAAAAALGRLGAKEGTQPLLDLLERGQALARVEAIDALGQIGSAAAGAPLVLELTSDRPEVRGAAARALGKLRHDGAAAGLEALRSDYYAEVRRAAVEALARLPVRAAGRR
jgi:HEAT repeat protein